MPKDARYGLDDGRARCTVCISDGRGSRRGASELSIKRTDVRVVNAFARTTSACPRERLFRIRTEWNPAKQSSFAHKHTWLSSGFVTDYTTRALTKVRTRHCCGTTGGSAVALALHACKTVTFYGLGG